ncbi:MAG: sodium:alanine symporter family protein, partial [Thalassolituus sp.]
MDFINILNSWAWGPPMLALIALTGLYLTIGLKAYPVRHLKNGFTELWRGRHRQGEGEISGFNA